MNTLGNILSRSFPFTFLERKGSIFTQLESVHNHDDTYSPVRNLGCERRHLLSVRPKSRLIHESISAAPITFAYSIASSQVQRKVVEVADSQVRASDPPASSLIEYVSKDL